MRKHGKVDDNQGRIVSVLRKIGCSVISLASVGGGCPDILVGFQGSNFLMEIKDGEKTASNRKLTDDQVEFGKTWKGNVFVVLNERQAFQVIMGKLAHTMDSYPLTNKPNAGIISTQK